MYIIEYEYGKTNKESNQARTVLRGTEGLRVP